MIYTLGDEVSYDEGLLKYGSKFEKLGKSGIYPGGIACQTREDAQRLLEELGWSNCAVYEVDADWEKDTVQSKSGWWHALIKDSVIIRKVVA